MDDTGYFFLCIFDVLSWISFYKSCFVNKDQASGSLQVDGLLRREGAEVEAAERLGARWRKDSVCPFMRLPCSKIIWSFAHVGELLLALG